MQKEMRYGLVALAVLLAPFETLASGWVVLSPKAAGLGEIEQQTFQDLIAGELRRKSGTAALISEQVCADERCACEVGQEKGTEKAVFSALSRLGQKWIVTVTSVHSGTCGVDQSVRESILQIEDLEEVSQKVAIALVDGNSMEDVTEVGTVTSKQEEPARLREGNSGPILGVLAVVPFGSLEDTFGVGFEGGYWFESMDLALHPRISFAFSSDSEDTSYGIAKFGAGAYYLMSRGEIAPFIGGGGGIRYVSEEKGKGSPVGSVIRLEPTTIQSEEAWAPGMFVTLGAMFMRTYSTRLLFSVVYDATFTELHDSKPIQSFLFNLSINFQG